MAVAGGYEELLGGKATWEGLVERLRRYCIIDVLDVLSRMSAALSNASDRTDSQLQVRICQGLFGPRASEVVGAAAAFEKRLRREGHTGPVLLFDDLQIINLLKVALLELPVAEEPYEEDLQWLGEALLMVRNLLKTGLEDYHPDEPPSDERSRQLELYGLANGLFYQLPDPMHTIARAYHLYFTDQAHLAGEPGYLDLPARVKAATGLPPAQAWTAMFALAGHWGQVTAENIHEQSGFVDRRSYFTNNLDLTLEESDQLFGLLCRPAEEMKREVQGRYALEDIKPFDVLPFARYPLIQVGDRIYCPSRPILMDKLYRGLHHVHLDQNAFSPRDRLRYLRFMGLVFEDYVHRLLTRVFPPESGRYVAEEELRGRVGGRKIADGLILYGSEVVVFEAKATQLRVEARAGWDWEAYESAVKEIFLDGLEQLASTIEALETGVLVVPGLPDKVTAYYPVLFTLEPFVMWPWTYKRITERTQAAGVSFGENVRPWQLIEIGELEFLEGAMKAGRSLADLLREKTEDDGAVGGSMMNFMALNQENLPDAGVNPFLAEIFEQIGLTAQDWARERTRRGSRSRTATLLRRGTQLFLRMWASVFRPISRYLRGVRLPRTGPPP